MRQGVSAPQLFLTVSSFEFWLAVANQVKMLGRSGLQYHHRRRREAQELNSSTSLSSRARLFLVFLCICISTALAANLQLVLKVLPTKQSQIISKISFKEASSNLVSSAKNKLSFFGKSFYSKSRVTASPEYNKTIQPDDGLFVRSAVGFFTFERQSTFVPQLRWFHASWKYMQSFEDPNVRTDLVLVTTGWHPVLDYLNCTNNTRVRKVGEKNAGACIVVPTYVSLEKRKPETFKNYKFADSIDAVSHAFTEKVLTSYDWILRTDLDTFLTPAFATWRPESMVVGLGSFCFSGYDTCLRLEQIAMTNGWWWEDEEKEEEFVENIGSTWYGPAEVMEGCSALSIEVMTYLHENEFTEKEKSTEYGVRGWPAWHHGVLTLYSGNIAINYCAKNAGFVKDARMLDFPSTSGESTLDHAHVHTWQNSKLFSKFQYENGAYKDQSIEALNLTVIHDYAMYMALTGNSESYQ